MSQCTTLCPVLYEHDIRHLHWKTILQLSSSGSEAAWSSPERAVVDVDVGQYRMGKHVMKSARSTDSVSRSLRPAIMLQKHASWWHTTGNGIEGSGNAVPVIPTAVITCTESSSLTVSSSSQRRLIITHINDQPLLCPDTAAVLYSYRIADSTNGNRICFMLDTVMGASCMLYCR